MSSIDNALCDLQAAFLRVAGEIEKEHPRLWQKVNDVSGLQDGSDIRPELVIWLTQRHPVGFGGKTLLEVAQEYGEESAIKYIQSIEHGGFA